MRARMRPDGVVTVTIDQDEASELNQALLNGLICCDMVRRRLPDETDAWQTHLGVAAAWLHELADTLGAAIPGKPHQRVHLELVRTADAPGTNQGAGSVSQKAPPTQLRDTALTQPRYPRAVVGRDLLIAATETNDVANGSLRDAELAGELALGLECLAERPPNEIAAVPGENYSDLSVSENPGSADRAFHDRAPFKR